MRVLKTKQDMLDEMQRIRKEAEKYPVGSEQYANCCKDIHMLAETVQKMSVSPDTAMKCTFFAGGILFVSWYQKHNILDFKPVREMLNLIKF